MAISVSIAICTNISKQIINWNQQLWARLSSKPFEASAETASRRRRRWHLCIVSTLVRSPNLVSVCMRVRARTQFFVYIELAHSRWALKRLTSAHVSWFNHRRSNTRGFRLSLCLVDPFFHLCTIIVVISRFSFHFRSSVCRHCCIVDFSYSKCVFFILSPI